MEQGLNARMYVWSQHVYDAALHPSWYGSISQVQLPTGLNCKLQNPSH